MTSLTPTRVLRPGKPTFGNLIFESPVASTQNVLSGTAAETMKNIGNALQSAARK